MLLAAIRLLHTLFPSLHDHDLKRCALVNGMNDVVLITNQRVCWCGDRKPA